MNRRAVSGAARGRGSWVRRQRRGVSRRSRRGKRVVLLEVRSQLGELIAYDVDGALLREARIAEMELRARHVTAARESSGGRCAHLDAVNRAVARVAQILEPPAAGDDIEARTSPWSQRSLGEGASGPTPPARRPRWTPASPRTRRGRQLPDDLDGHVGGSRHPIAVGGHGRQAQALRHSETRPVAERQPRLLSCSP